LVDRWLESLVEIRTQRERCKMPNETFDLQTFVLVGLMLMIVWKVARL